jgi:RNA polymerase sigma-B factor
MQERHLSANRAMDVLTAQLQRTPTMRELGESLGLEPHEAVEALAIGTSSWVSELTETDAVIEDQEAVHDDRLLVAELLARLPTLDRAILVTWLLDGVSQEEVGRRFGLTQVQVCRSARRSLRALQGMAARSVA